MGFVLVVGFSVVLLAVLQVLILAWLVDTAKSARSVAEALRTETDKAAA